MTGRQWIQAIAVAVWLSAVPVCVFAADGEAVSFDRDIRPILSNHCYACHGPDEKRRKGGLRLDSRAGAFAARDDGPVIAPGDPDGSELIQRVTSDDAEERMPPASAGRPLSGEQIATLRRWVRQGASWQDHWSFIAPRRPSLPTVSGQGWPNNPIDRFILARLEREDLRPSTQAPKETLIRRVTLDLTGLPPTPADVDAFLADSAPGAYERVVDRLLACPRYGERMAIRWCDAARYADTSGYQNDGPRSMWRWRDWVIDAYNRNMPFDQFTIEQIAGDMLADPTLEQRIATGFNRNHRGNSEGGIIPEEYAVEYVVDRVDTTATVWLGLTMACGRCHDHKYDPITQEEFYRVYAFFNNIPEHGRAVKEGNSPPTLKAPTPRDRQALQVLDRQLAQAEARAEQQRSQLTAALSKWESTQTGAPVQWFYDQDLVAHFALDGGASNVAAAASTDQPEMPTYGPGRIESAADFDGQSFIDAGDVGKFGYFDKFSLAAWIHPPRTGGGTILSRMTDTPRGDGYYVQLIDGTLRVNLVKRWLDDSIRVEAQPTIPADRWSHILVTYDGSRVADGIRVYVNGQPVRLKVHLDAINQSFKSKQPFRIGAGGGPNARFRGAIDDVRVYARCLSAEEVAWVATADSITDIVATAPDDRSSDQASKLEAYFLAHHAPDPIRQAYRHRESLRRERQRFIERLPTVMVMREMDPPRRTHVLIRGVYDKPGKAVEPGVPASLPPLPPGAPANRLGFARWLVHESNPLTARVAVNRYWKTYFGQGLVKTPEDFGTQGERPSHPELLDWLATEFMRLGWDVKAMAKTIVMSATYRQASDVSLALLAKDPENRLLARGPRFRLSAEMVRDQALAL